MNSTKTFLKFFAACLYCINVSFALDLALVKENLLKKTREHSGLDIVEEGVGFVENKVFNHKTYVFVIAEVGGYESEVSKFEDFFSCINVLQTDKIIFDYCDKGIMRIQTKGNFWTLQSQSIEYASVESYRHVSYLTFRLINDTFYLHQFSYNHYIFDRICDSIDEQLLVSNIYYRQPRDDPKKENLIPLDFANEALFSEMIDRYCERGLCQEVDWEVVQELRNKGFNCEETDE